MLTMRLLRVTFFSGTELAPTLTCESALMAPERGLIEAEEFPELVPYDRGESAKAGVVD